MMISMTEMEDAAKSLKGKMCIGHDGIPLKILKDSIPTICLPMKLDGTIMCRNTPGMEKLYCNSPP
jgi:hypothetical protein